MSGISTLPVIHIRNSTLNFVFLFDNEEVLYQALVTSAKSENLSTENELNLLKVKYGKVAKSINSLKKLMSSERRSR
jgi:hypothetical protein